MTEYYIYFWFGSSSSAFEQCTAIFEIIPLESQLSIVTHIKYNPNTFHIIINIVRFSYVCYSVGV